MPCPSDRLRATLCAAFFLSCLAAGGCRTPRAKVWNLKQLHADDGAHQHRAALMSDTEYLLRASFSWQKDGEDSLELKSKDKVVPDPLGKCLENMVGLADFDPADPLVAAMQVEWFSRLAVRDPWRLSRERASLELGRAGKRLGISPPVSVRPEDGPRGPGEVREVLRNVLAAVDPLLEGSHELSPGQLLDVEAACELVTERPLNLDGALIGLRATGVLLQRARDTNRDLECLELLCERLQRVCIEQALAVVLNDADPRVLGAGVSACVRALGPKILPDFLMRLGEVMEPELIVAVLHEIAAHGLPIADPDLTADEVALVRHRWLGMLWGLANNPEGQVQVAAMKALMRTSDSQIVSLRQLDWQAWWHQRAAAHESARPGGPSSAGKGANGTLP